MKRPLLILLVSLLLLLPARVLQASPPSAVDPRCSTQAPWWGELISIGNTFGEAMAIIDIQQATAELMLLHVHYRFELLLMEAPECGHEVISALSAHTKALADRLLFDMVSSGMHLDAEQIGTVSDFLDDRVSESAKTAKTAYSAFKSQYGAPPADDGEGSVSSEN